MLCLLTLRRILSGTYTSPCFKLKPSVILSDNEEPCTLCTDVAYQLDKILHYVQNDKRVH
jgi:hypothetical protein